MPGLATRAAAGAPVLLPPALRLDRPPRPAAPRAPQPRVPSPRPPVEPTRTRRTAPLRRAQPPTQPRIAALDGLRALAIAGVLAYHAGLRAVPGGLFGVDLFFVLSGFLITSLLLAEHGRSSRVRLGAFWQRRARRLLPALVVVVGVVLVATRGRAAGDALASFGYLANWHDIASGRDYFAQFHASPLRHLWSLSVEEQFYLGWPLLVWLVSRRQGPTRACRRVLLVAIATTAASTGWAVHLAAAGASQDRLYEGTDVRVVALLVGATLAAFVGWRRARQAAGRGRHRAAPAWHRPALALLSLAGLGGWGFACARIAGDDPRLARGGWLGLAVAAAMLLAGCLPNRAGRPGPLAILLGRGPLPLLGRLSYSIYLWHWPLFLLLTSERTELYGPALAAARIAAAVGAGALSYLLIEQPTQRGAGRAVRVFAVGLALLSVGCAVASRTVPARFLPGSAVAATAASAPVSTPAAVRVLVVGDSVAATMADAVAPFAAQQGVELHNSAVSGCGLAPGSRGRGPDLSYHGGQPCSDWPTWWQDDLASVRPQVVLLAIGRWEIGNRRLNGTTVHIGQPGYDAALSDKLDRAIRLLSASGARVGLVELPCLGRSEQADGSVDPATSQTRVDAFNRLLVRAAVHSDGRASVVNLTGTLCPGGQFTAVLNGVRIRSDDTHLAPGAGAFIAPALFDAARRLAQLP